MPLLLGMHWLEDDPGGLNRYLASLFTALRAAGLRPTAAVSGPAANAPVGVTAAGHFDSPIPVRLWAYTRAANRAAKAGATVVDAHFAFHAFWPVVAGRLRRLPLVVHFQGPWAEESAANGEAPGWRISAKRRVESSVYHQASALIVLSAAFKQLLVERYGIAPWLIHVVPPGIDLDQFAPGDQAAARDHLGLPHGPRLVVAVRRLVPRMGLDVLIDAWARIQPNVRGALLIVVGDGPERRRLEELAEGSGVGESVRFLGQVDEEALVRGYQAADLSVVPSVALEGFGLVVLESLACGTPVIATDAGGLPEALRSLDASLVVPAGDANALADRICSSLNGTKPLPDPQGCRTHAETFAWPLVAERHRAIYSSAINQRKRKLRVVYVDHCARLSGGELALLRLLPSLTEVDAHVILGEDGPLVARLREAGMSVEVLAMADAAGSLQRDRVRPGRLPVSAVTYSVAYVARLATRLRRLRPDLVHTNSLKSALYGGAAARLAAVPAVWHIRDRITDDYLPATACRLVRAAGRVLPAALIANSHATLETLGRAGAGGVAIASPLGFVPLARTPATRARPLRVGMVGRLDHWKGQHVFLDAFAKAFPDGQEKAVIVGASLFDANNYASELERQVTALAIDERVEFLGFSSDVEDELRHVDVLVHASIIPEPFGQVVVEGMAVGLPVVATNAGGPAEIIHHGIDGLLYPPGDVGALALTLQRLAAEPGLRQRLGDAALLRALDFTPEHVAPQVMAVYERVVGHRAES